MPQENQVLRCFSCETFQVHIVKKVKKWECKICGAKQSFKRHYGKGSGKDCRNHVMKLNELRFANSHSKNLIEDEISEEAPLESKLMPVVKKSVSKWAQYLDEDIDSENEDFKPEKRRKISEEDDKVRIINKKLDTDSDRFGNDQLNAKGSSKQTDCLQAEEDKTKRKKSKNIFDSGLDSVEDFLNFI